MRYLIQSFCCLLCFSDSLFAKFLELKVNAESAIVMNADTGAILYEKNSHKPQFPASITKVATALYALTIKRDQLDHVITADAESIASVTEAAIRRSNYTLPSYYIEQGSSHMGIKKDEELKFSDLLYGMMLPSANDAANVIAGFVSGSIPQFVKELNEYVKIIGCKNSKFCNPHGLHHPEHMTTAYDMALITKEALKEPFFKEIVKTPRFTRPKTNKQEPTTLMQYNKLLKKNGPYYYDKAIGVKTGYTSLALNTFIGAATHGERTLVVVLLKTKERNDIFVDALHAFEKAFSESKMEKTLISPGKQKFVLNHKSLSTPIETYALKEVKIQYYPSEEPKIRSFLSWDVVEFPITKGQRVGEIIIQNESTKSREVVPLFAENDVSRSWFSWLVD